MSQMGSGQVARFVRLSGKSRLEDWVSSREGKQSREAETLETVETRGAMGKAHSPRLWGF